MRELVIASVAERKIRSALTALGVAVGAALLLLTSGLARGQLSDRARREASSRADLFVRPGGAGMSPLSTALALDLGVVPEIEAVDGVRAVTPIAQHVERSEASAFGFRSFDGIDFDGYADLSGLRIVEGRPFRGPGEAIVDEYFARTGQGSVGDSVSLLGTPLTIVGVYAPESMSRIKVPISTVQDRFAATGLASMLAISVREGVDPEPVARRLRERLPDHQIVLTRDLPALYSQRVPGLDVFLGVVVGLSGTVSALVVMLTMYATVVERTRQIGVLKSLGASRGLIVGAIEAEATMLTSLGLLAGYVAATIAAAAIQATTTLHIEIGYSELFGTIAVALLGGGLGALYPAIRAARLDPVEALMRD